MHGPGLISLPLRLIDKLRNLSWRSRLSHFGDGAYIHSHVVINNPERVSLGANASLNSFCHLWGGGGITIGENSLIASHCTLTSLTHDTEAMSNGQLYRETIHRQEIIVGSNVWIGAGCIVLPGVKIGDNSVIGAGSVVTSDIPANCIAFGVPARVRRSTEHGATEIQQTSL